MQNRFCYRMCFFIFLTVMVFFLCVTGCSGKTSRKKHASGGGKRKTVKECLSVSAPGTTVYEDSGVSIDASNSSDGYVMIRYSGSAAKAKIQMQGPSGDVYAYNLTPGDYQAFPLSEGDGRYHIDILEHAYDSMYALLFSQDLSVTISDPLKPFLYPNQYVWFTKDFKAVEKGISLSENSSGDLEYVESVYRYIIKNITYDKAAAQNISADYLPDIDRTLASGKGICFDYASLMAAMLRSQGIPTKLEVGYSGTAYHAWISVYLREKGWIDKVIEFDGKGWSLMDPTLASSNGKREVRKYVGDGSNYTVKFHY